VLLIFSFNFRLLSAFIAWLKYSDFQLLIRNFLHKITSKHTVKVNKLYVPMDSWDHADSA